MQIQITTIDNGYIVAIPPQSEGEKGHVFYAPTPEALIAILPAPTSKVEKGKIITLDR